MPRTPTKVLRFVDDEQIDAGGDGLFGELGLRRQQFQRDDAAPMDVEGIESCAEIALDVGESLRVEQREHLVILPPQLAEPLNRQRLWRDDEASLHPSRVHETIQDQRRLDRLAQTDLVCQQPAHGIGGARAFGNIELVRKESNAAAQERAEPSGFAQPRQVQDVETNEKVFDRIGAATRQSIEERTIGLCRRVVRDERVGIDGKPERGLRSIELNNQRSAFDGDDTSDTKVRVEPVDQVVAGFPGHSAIKVTSEVGDPATPDASCAQ